MEKEIEALEYFADSYKEFLKGKDTHCQITLTREQATEFVKEVKDVYQALTELKQIKEAKPSEALMELEVLKDILNEFLKNNLIDKAFNTIKQALLKAQEQDKVLEIIKEKIIWVENGKLMCGRYADIEIELKEDDFENKEEFDLLKRYLNGK